MSFISYQFHKQDSLNQDCLLLFTHGCNLRCPYCFNPNLVIEKAKFRLSDLMLKDILAKHREKTDWVVISGGDPLIQGIKILDDLKLIKSYGYKIELCTNGTFFDILKEIEENNLVDFYRIDYKCVRERALSLGYTNDEFDLMEDSISLLSYLSSSQFEVRTTLHQKLISQSEIERISERVAALNVKRYGVICFDNSVETIAKMPNFENIYDFSQIKLQFREFFVYRETTSLER